MKKESIKGILNIGGPLIYHNSQLIETGYTILTKDGGAKGSYFNGEIPEYFNGRNVRLDEQEEQKYFGLVNMITQKLKLYENENKPSFDQGKPTLITSITTDKPFNRKFDWWESLHKK
ncbi:MAG: hypothetical protein PF542_00655 [Nanoarchaeota archaeon]|jgi:hypothetical protein|nr:hypothetical protein [Nanoarchaeota archaeon]